MSRRRSHPRLGWMDKPEIDEIWMLRHCPDRDPSVGTEAVWVMEEMNMQSCEAEAYRDEDDVIERVEEISWEYYGRLYNNLKQNKTPFSTEPLRGRDQEYLADQLKTAHGQITEGDPMAAFDTLAECINTFDNERDPTLMINEVSVYSLKPTDLKPVSMNLSGSDDPLLLRSWGRPDVNKMEQLKKPRKSLVAKGKLNPNEAYFITEIAEGAGGSEGIVDVEGFYDADSAAERLDYRTKDIFNHLVSEVNAMDEEGEDENGNTRDDYVNNLESAKRLIDQGEYQAALDGMSQMIMYIMSQVRWTTELLHAEEVR